MIRIASCILLTLACASAHAAEPRRDSYVENARDIAVQQPGPHEGKGTTTAYPFFEDADGFDIVFRQRALHPGATIGEHRNDKDEIYYVLSGRGELLLDGQRREVGAGDAILTRDGSTHALAQRGADDLVIIVVYRKRSAPAKP
ncbi:MAG TPA: cupin domain-containing protein [Lysobacter sp.]